MSEATCLFCRIVAGEIAARVVYEDEQVLAFHDLDPKAPIHVLVIPRKHISSIAELQDSDAPLVGALFGAARDIARDQRISASGFRLVINAGPDAGQSVDHVHLHVLGGRRMNWPPG